jgi:hypothetical protein
MVMKVIYQVSSVVFAQVVSEKRSKGFISVKNLMSNCQKIKHYVIRVWFKEHE